MNHLILVLLLLPFAIAVFDPSSSTSLWYLNCASYCQSSRISTWDVSSINAFFPNVTDIKVYENPWTNNLGYMAYSPPNDTIYVIFRGTMDTSIMNWVFQNVNVFKTKLYTHTQCDGCYVHEGFYQAYLNLNPSQLISDIKNLYQKYPSAKIVVSGHSLGGAMAYFGFLDICDALGKVDLLMTYGAPRIGNWNFAQFFKQKTCGGDKIRITHHRDPVPHVPPSLFGFYHGYSEVFYDSANEDYQQCVEPEDYKCSKQYDYTSINPLDHVDYHNFNQQYLMFTCNSLFDLVGHT